MTAAVLLLGPAAQAAGVGTSGADFLNVGVGARQLAMGGAATAVTSDVDANAVNWNPGALGFVRQTNVTASYNALFQDENQGYLGYAAPMGEKGALGTFALGLNYLLVSDIQARTSDTESPDSTFSDQNYALTGSYGHKIGDDLSVGGTLRYIREYMPGLSANALAVDFGGLYRTPVSGLSAGAAVRNLGNDIGPDALPITAQGGLAYAFFGGKATLASDFDWLATEKTAYLDLGGELWLNRILAVRAGYQFGHGADQLQSSLVGMGVGIGLKVSSLSVDYAFLPYGDLGDTHRITLGFHFD